MEILGVDIGFMWIVAAMLICICGIFGAIIFITLHREKMDHEERQQRTTQMHLDAAGAGLRNSVKGVQMAEGDNGVVPSEPSLNEKV